MKRLIIISFALCFTALTAFAQKSSFVNKDNVLSFGVGFGSNLYTGSGYTNSLPALSLSYEHCIKDKLFDAKSSIGIGGIIGYASAEWKYSVIDYGVKYTNIIIGARGALHYAFVDNLDVYGGILLGYDIVSSEVTGSAHYTDYEASGSDFVGGGFIGARYYFSNNFGAFAELGYGIASLNLGISYKF